MKAKEDLKILILYASYGDGHVQVSKALQQCFQAKGIRHVLLIDLYASASPLINTVTRFAYLISCSFCPKLYGWSYYLTKNMRQNRGPVKWLNTFGFAALKEIIRVERPDAVINTFPMSVMSELRLQSELQIPIFTVLTDFVLHDRWLHQEIDKYFVATGELKSAIVNKGIPDERIRVSGIPLRKDFCRPEYDKGFISRYGLDPSKKTVLIMAGAYGVMQDLNKICRALLPLEDIQILLVCGKNQALKDRMEAGFARKPNVFIFGFIEHIEEFMSIASCMITKAGGITLSEALSMNLPVIVFRPLPGQELENALFLAEKGAVMIAHKTAVLVNHVKQILYEPQHLSQMKQAIYALQKKNATENIANDILEYISQE